jgi:hypothetical protein
MYNSKKSIIYDPDYMKIKRYLEDENILSEKEEQLEKIYNQKYLENIETKISLLQNMKNPCSDELQSILEWQYPYIDYDKLSTLASQQFYNPKVMETMSCLVMSQLNSEQQYMDLLKDVKIIDLGKNKEDMIVFFSNLANGKNKVLTFKYDGEDILNEAVIGLVMNLYRQEIPTFSWTYGLTRCNLPMFVKDGKKVKMVSACRKPVQIGKEIGKGDYIGLVTEYIDGPTFQDYLSDSGITVKNFRSAMLTILYSIRYTNLKLKYVHWDLHDSNILMRKLNSKDNYIYLKNDNKYLYVGDHLATIIDFGFNSLVKSNILIANYSRNDIGINPDASVSSKNDLLKLLNYLYRNLYGKKIFPEIEKLYSLFTGIRDKKELNRFHKLITKKYGIYPNDFDVNGKTIDDFISVSIEDLIIYLTQLQPDLVVDSKPNNVLGCQKEEGKEERKEEGNCWDEKQIIQEIFSRKQMILNLSDLLGYKDILRNKNQNRILNEFIKDNLDQIFIRMETLNAKKTNSPLGILMIENELRLLDNDLKLLYEITSELKLALFIKQISKMKTQIIRMIKKYEKLGSQLLKMDPKPIYAQLIGPKDQKRRWLNDLYQDFFTLMNQYKYPSYLSKEATKRKASKSPNVSVSPRKQKKRKEVE